MTRRSARLSVRGATALAKPGRHADGDGLYLVVDKSGAKRWVFLFRRQGKLREMGLGGFSAVSLAQARALATEARFAVATGRDPIADRQQSRRMPTFGEIGDELVASLSPEWRNEKHLYQWKMSLEGYAKSLRSIPVNEVSTEDVLKVLRPIWTTKSETASRVRGRIERVLNAAKALGHRSGENPALWRGHLQNLLPRRKKLTRGHLAAMNYANVPEFLGALRSRPAVSARALEFTILTAARTSEALKATWPEVDLGAKLWTVPASRMKGHREHRVPLSEPAVRILGEMQVLRNIEGAGEFIFPGQRRGRPLSGMAMEMLLRRMNIANATVHGFRSAFRDWVGEATVFPREVAEAALAHTIGNEVERAYRRGDALAKRRELMDAWAAFLELRQSHPDVFDPGLAEDKKHALPR